MKYLTLITGFLCVALFVLSPIAQSQSAKNPAPKAPKKLQYLTPAQIDPSRLLEPPAKDGSEKQQREMAAVKRMIQTRTAERYTQAKWDAAHEDATPFAAAIGPAFDLEKLPATSRLLQSVLNDQGIAASTAKDYFRRKFPVTAEMPASYSEWTCDTVDRKPESRPLRGYPSGHGTLGYSLGVVLAALIPEKSQAILVRAADYAYSREVCGDHYHSDVEASRALGTAVAVMLLNNAALKPQIDAAKAELRTAHLTSE
jgi:acid phosphatase (class A)